MERLCLEHKPHRRSEIKPPLQGTSVSSPIKPETDQQYHLLPDEGPVGPRPQPRAR